MSDSGSCWPYSREVAVVEIFGGPAPYREAIQARLVASGHEARDASVASAATGTDGEVSVIFCGSDAGWDQLHARAVDGPVVAVLAELDIALYARALAAGAGVVHLDTSTEIMMGVIESAVASEALVPMAIAQHLAAHWKPQTPLRDLDPVETQLAEALRAGIPMQRIADEMHYSDRTVRRKLQGLYLKLGANNRAEAIQILMQMG